MSELKYKKIALFGCSFSCEPQNGPWVGWPTMLQNDNLNTLHLENYSAAGMGNTQLSNRVINYIRQSSPELLLIQWSAFSRCYATTYEEAKTNFLRHNGGDDWLKYYNIDWEVSNGISTNDFHLENLTKDITKNSLETIVNLMEYLDGINQNYKMWFGWQQVYPEQIEEFGLTHLTDKIKNNKNFYLFNQKECYDYELENYGLISKSNYPLTLKKLFGLDKGNYFHPATEWGGMTEYIRENMDKDKYVSPTDMHPSTKGHEFFYNTFIKEILK